MTQEEKQEEREYWTKLLADGPVWCEVWSDEKSNGVMALVIAYVGGNAPFITINNNAFESYAREIHANNNYYTYGWKNATTIVPKPRRPWTAEEIMAHGVFERNGKIVKVLSANSSDTLVASMVIGESIYKGLDTDEFIKEARAVCLELRDGILCDTGKRIELYKDGE